MIHLRLTAVCARTYILVDHPHLHVDVGHSLGTSAYKKQQQIVTETQTTIFKSHNSEKSSSSEIVQDSIQDICLGSAG